MLTQREYAGLLAVAGFADITITPTYKASAGLHFAVIQATKPATGPREPAAG